MQVLGRSPNYRVGGVGGLRGIGGRLGGLGGLRGTVEQAELFELKFQHSKERTETKTGRKV